MSRKKGNRESRRDKRSNTEKVYDRPIYNRPKIEPKNELQKKYINSIRNSNIILGTGVAGTGKTYIAAALAADYLDDPSSPIERIVIARPNQIEGTRTIGSLPGDKNEKMAPWVAPVAETLKQRMGEGAYNYKLEHGIIELLPLEYIKGRTFNNTFVIIDEAEDIEWSVLKTLLLRVGLDCKLVIDGDVRQTSLNRTSGLSILMKLLEEHHLPIMHVDFPDWSYCVRSNECALMGEVFEKAKL